LSPSPDNFEHRWLIQATLARAGQQIGLPAHGLDTIELGGAVVNSVFDLATLYESVGQQVGLQAVRTKLNVPDEIRELLRDGMAVVLIEQDYSIVFSWHRKSTYTATKFQDHSSQVVNISRKELSALLVKPTVVVLAVKPLLDCDAISASPVYAHVPHGNSPSNHHAHHHLTPLARFRGLFRMERSDIGLVAIFAFASSVLSLSTPLAVESLVNVISWGIYFQPLIILALILLTSLLLAATFGVLQNVVVEIIQRRQFVRLASDLAHRFPLANREQIKAEHPRELANRVLDIITIQKSTAVLLLDATNIVIVSIVGLLLLSFYHAYLLGFALLMLVLITVLTWALGIGGVDTAIEESKTKYRLVHWLQDVLDSPTAFRINGGNLFGINEASSIATDYVMARQQHFRVLIRQIVFVAGLQALALSAVLGIGGWLVMQGDMTLGQLVAAELVVTLVVGAFSKAGKSIEKFYDILAAMDKVGHLLDLETDSNAKVELDSNCPLPINWSNLEFDLGLRGFSAPEESIEAGQLVAIRTSEPLPRIAETLAGLFRPLSGTIRIMQFDVSTLSVAVHQGRKLNLAGRPEVFHGTVASNIDMGRDFVGLPAIREALEAVNLWTDVSTMPSGLDTRLQSTGFPMTPVQLSKLMIARSLVARPQMLIVDGLLDCMTARDQESLIAHFQSIKPRCTTVLITQRGEVAELCDRMIDWRLP
jgi:putative ABC transport system ATP-binding protein